MLDLMRTCFALLLTLWCSATLALEFRGIVVGGSTTPSAVAAAIAGKCGGTWEPGESVGSKGIVERIDFFLEGDREQARGKMLTRLGVPTRISTNGIVVGNKKQYWEISTWELGGGVRASFRWTPEKPSKSIFHYNTKEEAAQR